jgi:hypothetical protein
MKKIFLSILSSYLLFAGGDILPIEPMTKFEKMDNKWSNQIDTPEETLKSGEGCLNIDNLEPAELLPYSNEDIPDAQTEPYVASEEC